MKKDKYLEAIAHFEASYTFFNRYKWLDKYRYLTLLSSSRISYQEMALCNIAFCYVQGGNHVKGKEYYMTALLEYPESYLAQSALKFFIEEKD